MQLAPRDVPRVGQGWSFLRELVACRTLLFRFGFFWLSVLAVCLLSPFPQFRNRRRVGRSGRTRRPHVFLIRGAAAGIIPYWPAAHELAAHLSGRGFEPTIINHYEYPHVAREIASALRDRRIPEQVSIVGYSFGADAASLLGESLERVGVDVEAVVLIESTWGIPVPANVAHCINYYKTRALDWIPSSRGVPVAAQSSRTRLTNVSLADYADLREISCCSHFTIGDNHRLHRLVGDFLESCTPSRVMNRPGGAAAAHDRTNVWQPAA